MNQEFLRYKKSTQIDRVFILNAKENTEVFSFCDEFGNYFTKINKKVSKNQKERLKL
jgi:hypothetical protein